MEKRGLGIKDISKFNGVLLAKRKWRLVSDEQGKWKDILCQNILQKHIEDHCRQSFNCDGGETWPRYAVRMKKEGGSNQLYNEKLVREIRSYSGRMPGWGVINFTIFTLSCFLCLWTRGVKWERLVVGKGRYGGGG